MAIGRVTLASSEPATAWSSRGRQIAYLILLFAGQGCFPDQHKVLNDLASRYFGGRYRDPWYMRADGEMRLEMNRHRLAIICHQVEAISLAPVEGSGSLFPSDGAPASPTHQTMICVATPHMAERK